ncbi:MAG: type II toxin-antitoxin system VapC family toxin [Nitriliruptorales bacterium]|nr:type II toxin-antitoxin system VapC family toxin [Nitriliruptorales bacterium]
MSVIDASVFADALLVAGPRGDLARDVVAQEHELHVPEIFPTEVLSAIRGHHLAARVSTARARRAMEQLATVRLERYPVEPFIDRIWELRDNLTVYDAAYVALAERLETTFVTADRPVARAATVRCEIRKLRNG